MKVLLVSTLARGGPVEQTVQLAAGLRDRGLSVGALCATEQVAERLTRVGVTARVHGLAPGVDVGGARRLRRVMAGADVVHAQDRRAGLWTRLAPGLPTVARVYTVHGLPDPYLPPPLGASPPALRDRLAYELVDAGLAHRADALILPSQALADQFIERLRYPASRIAVVPNGVAVGAPLARRGDDVGTLSLLEPVKDLETFLRAAARLAAARPQLRFQIAGDGSRREALEARARSLGLGSVVRFTGFVEPRAALSRLAVLVMCSIFENAPMAVLEAMAGGVPVVASRTGGLPEMLGDDGGLLVTPGDDIGFADAIARLLDDRDLVTATTRAAGERVRSRFSVAANAAGTAAVYERVAAARRR